MSSENAKARLPALSLLIDNVRNNITDMRSQLNQLYNTCTNLQDDLNNAKTTLGVLDADLTPPFVIPSSSARLSVDNGVLRSRPGQALELRISESTYGSQSAAATATVFGIAKEIGFNGVAPLPNTPQFTLAELTDMCAESFRQRLVLVVNVDQAGGMPRLTDPAMVALLNAQPHVFLECAVELGSGMSEAAWFDTAKTFIKQLRDAGHKSLIKVGSPDGGRSPRFALNRGKDLLAFDPEHNLCFTCQMYWSVTGNWYQQLNGFTGGLAGCLAALDAFAASGLVFLVGFDAEDDIGLTGYAQLITRALALKLSFLWWELALDSRAGNNLVTGALSSELTTTGQVVKRLLSPIATSYDL